MDSPNLTNEELLDRYFRGELSDEQTSLFQQKMASQEFSMEQQELAQIIQGLGEVGENELKQKFRNWDLDRKATALPIQKRPINRWWIGIAAGVALLVFSLVWMYKASKTQPWSEALLVDFPDYISQMNRDVTIESTTYSELMSSYRLQQWDQANQHLSNHLLKSPEDHKIWLYHGIVQIRLQNWEQATQSFAKVQSLSNDPTYVQPAEWYQVLGWLENRQTTLAISLLESIASNPDHYQQEAAQNLLGNITL